jgi:hypothetical protein
MVETYVSQAIECVDAEQAAIEDRREAYERFSERLREIPVRKPQSARPIPAPSQGLAAVNHAEPPQTREDLSSEEGDAYVAVQTAFRKEVHPTTNSEHESIRRVLLDELGRDLATTLIAGNGPKLPVPLHRSLRTRIDERRQEIQLLGNAVERERTELEAAKDIVDETVQWLARTEETGIEDSSAGTARSIREDALSFKKRCETLLTDRQEFLHGTTANGGIAIENSAVIDELYDGPVDHPILDTACRLITLCRERADDCQTVFEGAT